MSEAQIWFFLIYLAALPIIILFVFVYLITKHPLKLYAIKDYGSPDKFISAVTNEEYVKHILELKTDADDNSTDTKTKELNNSLTSDNSNDKNEYIKHEEQSNHNTKYMFNKINEIYHLERSVVEYIERQENIFVNGNGIKLSLPGSSMPIYFDAYYNKGGIDYLIEIKYISTSSDTMAKGFAIKTYKNQYDKIVNSYSSIMDNSKDEEVAGFFLNSIKMVLYFVCDELIVDIVENALNALYKRYNNILFDLQYKVVTKQELRMLNN